MYEHLYECMHIYICIFAYGSNLSMLFIGAPPNMKPKICIRDYKGI